MCEDNVESIVINSGLFKQGNFRIVKFCSDAKFYYISLFEKSTNRYYCLKTTVGKCVDRILYVKRFIA